MSKNKSLIVTSKDDAHADYVIYKANKSGLGKRIVRLNTEDFNDNCRVVFRDGEFFIYIKDSERQCKSSDISSVWFRRPKDIKIDHPDADARNYMRIQATAYLRGLYFCTHDSALWINPLTSLHRARIKLQQLKVAIELGFNVPKTIVSNSPNDLINFFNNFESVCTKSLDEPNFHQDGFIYPMFTRTIKDKTELTDNIESLTLAPVLLQEYIPKKSDLRVIVLGKKVFAFEIFSQEHELSVHDFRGVSPNHLRHSVHELPNHLLKKIQNFMEKQGLYYSALDFVISEQGEYFFLENNSNGQWLWLEEITGVKISECLLNILLG